MKKKIIILGSTGSVGVNTLKIIDKDKKNFEIFLLSANKNTKKLLKQICKYMKIKSLLKRNFNLQPRLNYPDYKSSILRAPVRKKISLPSTISEICGPVFNCDIIGKYDNFKCFVKLLS